jgi:hypothetical protein
MLMEEVGGIMDWGLEVRISHGSVFGKNGQVLF